MADLSAYGGFLLWIMSAILAVRFAAANPACTLPESLSACLADNTPLEGSITAGLAGSLLVLGAFVLERRSKRGGKEGRSQVPEGFRAARVALPLAIALFLAVASLAFVPPPRHGYLLDDRDLDPAWVTYTTLEGSATIRAYAGDVLRGGSLFEWYELGSGRYLGPEGSGGWIVALGDPLTPGVNDLGNGYLVPGDGLYTVFASSTPCALTPCPGNPSENFTAVVWMNLTGTNPSILPTAQLGAAVAGAGSYLLALVATADGRR